MENDGSQRWEQPEGDVDDISLFDGSIPGSIGGRIGSPSLFVYWRIWRFKILRLLGWFSIRARWAFVPLPPPMPKDISCWHDYKTEEPQIIPSRMMQYLAHIFQRNISKEKDGIGVFPMKQAMEEANNAVE